MGSEMCIRDSHWYRAAMRWGESSAICPRSNFDGAPSEVGKYNVLSYYGCFDMAGNAREWGTNPHKNGYRSMMGGGYDDETYFFTDNYAQHPINRYKTNGFRCVIIPDDETNHPSAARRCLRHERHPEAQGPTFAASERFSVKSGGEDNGILHILVVQNGHPLSDFYYMVHDEWARVRPSPFQPVEPIHTMVLRAVR